VLTNSALAVSVLRPRTRSFPGTSVLHRRARYLLFIPWLLANVARKGRAVEESRKSLRDAEVKLIRSLIAGGEQQGSSAVNQAQEKLKTMPSQVYSPALGRLGLRHWDVSIDGYFRIASKRVRRSTETQVRQGGALEVGVDLFDDRVPAVGAVRGGMDDATGTTAPADDRLAVSTRFGPRLSAWNAVVRVLAAPTRRTEGPPCGLHATFADEEVSYRAGDSDLLRTVIQLMRVSALAASSRRDVEGLEIAEE